MLSLGHILAISSVVVSFASVPAYSTIEYYDSLDMMWFYKTPLVCAYEDMPKVMMDNVRNAVREWAGKMQATEKMAKDRHVWDIDYQQIPLDEVETFDISKCDITISFFDRPSNEADWYDKIGYTFYPDDENPRIDIEIYYENMEYCTSKTSDANYIYTHYNLCYNGRTKSTSEMTTTVIHELGHALGLGHYTLFNENRRESIMTPYEFDNPRLQVITPGDVEALLTIYGTDGFVNEWTHPNFLWPGWMAESLFEWYHDSKISDKEYHNAMKWYHTEAKVAQLD